jgi:hypothetical protein
MLLRKLMKAERSLGNLPIEGEQKQAVLDTIRSFEDLAIKFPSEEPTTESPVIDIEAQPNDSPSPEATTDTQPSTESAPDDSEDPVKKVFGSFLELKNKVVTEFNSEKGQIEEQLSTIINLARQISDEISKNFGDASLGNNLQNLVKNQLKTVEQVVTDQLAKKKEQKPDSHKSRHSKK